MAKKGQDQERAKSTDPMAAALRLISYRARSVKELEGRLIDKGFDHDEVARTVERLTQTGYLDDEVFAQELASSRLRNKSWGSKKIAFELGSKGIDSVITARVINAIDDLDQLEAAKRALKKWLNKRGSGGTLEDELKQKALTFLQSKGFPTPIIFSALNDL